MTHSLWDYKEQVESHKVVETSWIELDLGSLS